MSSLLEGGRRRRHGLARLVPILLALAPLVVGAAVFVSVRRDADADSPPLAVGGPAGGTALGMPRLPPPLPRDVAPTVRLSSVDAFRLRFRRTAPPRAALLFDVDSGDVLWRLNPLRVVPIASLTKIMTALLVAERTRPRDLVRITSSALRYSGSGVGVLPRGRRVPVEALMHGLLLVSGNDAARVLAGHVAGGEGRFVALMNGRARALGLRCTRFASSHGLERGNRSCTADLAVLTRLAMRNRRITAITRKRQAALPFPIRGGRLFLYGHNPLLRTGYAGAIGLKTGYTRAAGRCFVAVARRRGRTLAAVVLGSPDPGKQTAQLLNAGFRRG